MSTTDERTSLDTWADEHGLTMDAENIAASERPGAETWPKGARHYRCELANDEGETMTVFFTMGSALSRYPTREDVLDALASDIASVRNAADRWDWLEEMGGASRELDEAWDTIHEQDEDLTALVGEDALEALLWETERL